MASQWPPLKNTAFDLPVLLVDSGNRPHFKVNPTLGASDVRVSIDFGACAILETSVVATPASGALVKVALASNEMNGDIITVMASDLAGDEWDPVAITLFTTARLHDDLAYPTTTGRSMDITAGGTIGLDFDNVEGTIGASDLATDLDTYQAKVVLIDDDSGTTDRYSVTFFKNGEPVTTGITSPTIQVIKDADGTDLVASVALTEIASLGRYRHAETSNRIVDGAGYTVKVQATIGGATRTWHQPVGRDD